MPASGQSKTQNKIIQQLHQLTSDIHKRLAENPLWEDLEKKLHQQNELICKLREIEHGKLSTQQQQIIKQTSIMHSSILQHLQQQKQELIANLTHCQALEKAMKGYRFTTDKKLSIVDQRG